MCLPNLTLDEPVSSPPPLRTFGALRDTANFGLTNISMRGKFNIERTINSMRALMLAAGAVFWSPFGRSPASSAAARSMQCASASKGTIEVQFKRFNDSWQTHDPDKVTALFLPDAVLLPTVSNKPRTTHTEIRDYFDHFLLSRPIAKIDTSTVRVRLQHCEPCWYVDDRAH